MASISTWNDPNYVTQLKSDLSSVGDEAGAAAAISNNLTDAEKALTAAFKEGNETKIQEADLVYKKAQRMFELFSTVMNNAHQMMLRIINNMASR